MKATDHGHTGFPDGYGKVVRPQDNLAGALRGAEEAKERLLQKLEIADRPYPLRCASYCHPSSQGRGACCTAYFNSRNRDCHGLLGVAPHLTVVWCACNDNEGPGILLLVRSPT